MPLEKISVNRKVIRSFIWTNVCCFASFSFVLASFYQKWGSDLFCSVVLAGDQDGAWRMVANISPLTYAIRALKIFLNLIDFIFPKIRGNDP